MPIPQLYNYQKEIDNYKEQKNILTIPCPHIFCFLLGIGFKNDIDTTYSFIDEFFDMNLDLKEWKERYFIINIQVKNNL